MDRPDHFHICVWLYHLVGLRGGQLAQRRSRLAARMGARRTALRHDRHLVSDRRRSLHGLYFHCRPGTSLWRGRRRFLRGPLHDRRLPDLFPGVPANLARLPQTPLHHGGRFRARPLRQPLARIGGDDYRHRRDDALHRLAARRSAGRDRRARRLGHRLCGRPAVDHRFRDPGRLHLFERSARACLDRHRQGYPDLSDRLCRRDRHSD